MIEKNTDAISRNRASAMEQDQAAGGIQNRQLKLKTGDIVTVSLALSVSKNTAYGVLRFKRDRVTFRQSVGIFKKQPTRIEMLTEGWKRAREQKIVEKHGWSWVTSPK